MISTTLWRKGGAGARALAAVIIVASAFLQTVPAEAQMRSDARPAPNQTRPLPEIVAQVQRTPPYSGMDYIGVAGFESRSMVYILRFLDGRQVVVVHVDARSGRILGRAP